MIHTVLRKYCVLTISLLTFVSSTEVNIGNVGRNNTRNKRHHHFEDGWSWSNYGPRHHGFSHDYHHNHHHNFDYHHHNYGNNFQYNTPTTQVYSHYDPFTDPNTRLYNQIPPKLYFNQQPIKPVYRPTQSHIWNQYKENHYNYPNPLTHLNPHTENAGTNQKPTQIYINPHLYNDEQTELPDLTMQTEQRIPGEPQREPAEQQTYAPDRIENGQFNEDRLGGSPNAPMRTNPNNNEFKDTKDDITLTTERVPNPLALPSVIGATIDYTKVFGSDSDIGDQVISPTGSLTEFGSDDDGMSGIFAAGVGISCDTPYKPPKKPNFFVPGRRISEAQCYEYIFELKIKDDIERRNRQCNSNESTSKKPDFVTAVVGGREADPEEFSHMAAIGWRGVNEPVVFKCGGSIISPNFLLTAAHCRSSPPDTELIDFVPRIARVGGNTIGYRNTGQVYKASRRRRRRQARDPAQMDVDIINIITHENYDPNMQYYDIALMQLARPLEFSKRIKPACLWIDVATSNRIRRAVATGWGIENLRTRRTSLQLQAGDLDILDVNRCNDLLRGKFGRKFNGFADHQLCAGKLSGEIDVCQGDSGGPLQVKINVPTKAIGNMHSIVGLISAGPECGRANMPGIYTRVASFVGWIESKVWSNNK